MQTETPDQDGQAGAQIEATMEMCAAGAAKYRDWESDDCEQRKLNAVSNLVYRVYCAMERIRRQPLSRQ